MSESIEKKKLTNSKNATTNAPVDLGNMKTSPRGVPSVRVLQGNPGRGMPYRIDLFGGNGPVRKLSSMAAAEDYYLGTSQVS